MPLEYGYQFTPAGIIPLTAAAPSLGEHVSGATARIDVVRVEPRVAPGPSTPTPTQAAKAKANGFDPTKPLTGKQLMTAARRRIKEIDKILRNVDALKLERSQLSALIAAATKRKTDA